jgi:hypothetical protein
VPEQKAAAVLLLAQPGIRLLHEGQWAGHRRHTPVQFADHWPETGNPEMTAFYERLLSSLARTVIGNGEMDFCETGLPHCFAMKWEGEARRISLAVVNLAPHRADFQIRDFEYGGEWANVFSENDSSWTWRDSGLHIQLAGHGFALLELRPAVRST